MTKNVILDTGPLVAALDFHEHHHNWISEQLKMIKPPLLTCEAVLTESLYLLRKKSAAVRIINNFIDSGVIEIQFCLNNHIKRIFGLINKYKNIPMSFADACLVCMSEFVSESHVITLDNDFKIYRQFDRRIIPTIIPC